MPRSRYNILRDLWGDSVKNSINLVKLCVGIDSIEDLISWRARHNPKGLESLSQHVTRMWPKRVNELLDGGSLYWVIRGSIQARQRIIALNEAIGRDGIRRCAIVMDPEIIRTAPARRRPFQGWRYLSDRDAPHDLLAPRAGEDALPHDLSVALAEIGVR